MKYHFTLTSLPTKPSKPEYPLLANKYIELPDLLTDFINQTGMAPEGESQIDYENKYSVDYSYSEEFFKHLVNLIKNDQLSIKVECNAYDNTQISFVEFYYKKSASEHEREIERYNLELEAYKKNFKKYHEEKLKIIDLNILEIKQHLLKLEEYKQNLLSGNDDE